MKRIEERPPQTIEIVYRVLVIVAIAMAIILIAGTIYGLARKSSLGNNPAGGVSVPDAMFSGLGTMRIPTADPEPETLLVSIAFPYDKSDRPFSEELASRLSWFKTATAQYLGAFTAEELSALDAEAVKKELLTRYNSVLRLGQIKELYLHEYMRL